MNILDIFIGLPLIYAIYKGFTKGFVYEAASLIALILGVYGAIHFSDFTAEVIQDTFKYESQYMEYISFIVTFIVIVIGIRVHRPEICPPRPLPRFVAIDCWHPLF